MNCDTDVALEDHGGPWVGFHADLLRTSPEALRGNPAATFAATPRSLPPGDSARS